MTDHVKLTINGLVVYDSGAVTQPPTLPPNPPPPPPPPVNTGGIDISDGAIKNLGYVNDDQPVSVFVDRPGLIEVVPVSGTTIKMRADVYGIESLIGGSYQRRVLGGTYTVTVRTIGGNIAVVFRG